MDNVKFRLIAFAYFDNIPREEMTVANAFSIRDAPFNADEIMEFSKDEGERTMEGRASGRGNSLAVDGNLIASSEEIPFNYAD